MAISLSKLSTFEVAGSPISATYWHAGYVNIDFLNQRLIVSMLGYADHASFLASSASFILQQDIMFPNPQGSQQWPLDPTYLQNNFGSSGPQAYAQAIQAFVVADPFFAGASAVS